jgi:hypothetical protein
MLIAMRMVGEIPEDLVPIVRAFLLIGVVGAATTMVARNISGLDSINLPD